MLVGMVWNEFAQRGRVLRERHRPTTVGGRREAPIAEPMNQHGYKHTDATRLCTGTDDRRWGMWMWIGTIGAMCRETEAEMRETSELT